MVFLKKFYETVDFKKKICRLQKNMKNYPWGKKLKYFDTEKGQGKLITLISQDKKNYVSINFYSLKVYIVHSKQIFILRQKK